MTICEEGVSNFRIFQAEMRNFVTRQDTRENERLKSEKQKAEVEEQKAIAIDRMFKRLIAILTLVSMLWLGGVYLLNLFGPEIRHALGLK